MRAALARLINRLSPRARPEPLVVTQRYRRRTIDLLTLVFIETNGIRDALRMGEPGLTGTVLSTSWEVIKRVEPPPFTDPRLFDQDDILELTIILERA